MKMPNDMCLSIKVQKKQMIKKAELYAQDASKVYTDEIVCATANVIGYNVSIKIQAIHCTSSMTTVQVLIALTITVQ